MLKYILVAIAVVILFAVVFIRARLIKNKENFKEEVFSNDLFWLVVVVAIISSDQYMNGSNQYLTDSGPLSLFDLILLVVVVSCFILL